MRHALAMLLLLPVLAGTATAQEIRPTLDKIKETGTIQLGTLKPCDELRATVLRDEKVVELTMKWTGF
jgi:hypothetical protein